MRAADGRLLALEVDPAVDTTRVTVDAAPATTPGTQVVAILDVAAESLLLTTQDRGSTQVATLELATGKMQPLHPEEGVQHAVRGGSTTVVSSTSWASTRRVALVVRADGSRLTVVSHAETPALTPVVRSVPGTDLPTVVLLPRDHVPGSQRLPVLMCPYGGPHHVEVIAALGSYGEAQWFADQGFAVVVADGRGTPGRGPAAERAIAGDLASAPLQDQVAALTAAVAAFPDDLDTARVGIRGWSFGGFLAALAVLRRPDVFHAAVAGAPVTDWRRYDTAYAERYLGLPQDQPEAYDNSSLLAEAPSLSRPLLLVHGMTDDNVVVAHTLALSGALTAAGRPHQVLPLSGVTHFTPDEVIAENRLRLELDFLRGHLHR